MTERVHAHKARWRRTPSGRRLVCLCGWPYNLTMIPGATTARAFLQHIREVKAQQREANHV
jgi:hypothetical protein